MRNGMMLVGDADQRIRARAEFPGNDHAEDARDIRLEREGLQIVHEFRVLVERIGNIDGPVGQLDGFGILRHGGALDTLFDLAHGIHILAEFAAIARAKRVGEAVGFLRHGLENAAGAFRQRQTLGGAASIAEEAFKYDARVSFGGIRRSRTAPGNGIHKEAVARIAGSRRWRVDRHLKRRHLRGLADFPDGQLIGSGSQADFDSGLCAVVSMHAGEPCG
jgi:hypothetical protein